MNSTLISHPLILTLALILDIMTVVVADHFMTNHPRTTPRYATPGYATLRHATPRDRHFLSRGVLSILVRHCQALVMLHF